MAKADRLARLDDRRVELETEYRGALVAALRVTAAGKSGLFGQTRDYAARAAYAPLFVQLKETAAQIDVIRARFGMAAFALHPAFLAARGPAGPNDPGEPKLAAQWLARMGAPAD